MTFRERLRNPFVQQYLLEILLPLIGYFFFDWTLVIIAAFYVIDQIASEISFARKFSAIRKSENKSRLLFLMISIIVFLAMLCLESYLLMDYFAPRGLPALERFLNELQAFAKEELWLLFPLVLVMYYLKDQFTFFMPRRFLQKDSSRFFAWHWIENLVVLILLIAGSQLLKDVKIHEAIVIAIFLVIKIGFDFSIAKWADKKSNKI